MFCLLLSACGANKELIKDGTKFTKYKNPNTIGVNLDGIGIEDKYFEMLIPAGAKDLKIGGSAYMFMQVLNFGDDKKIIVIYDPSYKYSRSKPFKSPDNSYEEFKKLCANAEIILESDNIDLKHDKRFALYKILKEGFYVLCINLDKEDIKAFNYSVSTIKFPPNHRVSEKP